MARDNIEILINAKDKASKKLDKIGRAAKSMGKMAVVGGAVAAVAIGGIAIASINAAREQIRVEKQLDAVLKSTGGSAGLTAKEIKKMASELQTMTNFGDEAIINGQNLLLTFTNIGKNVFPDATQTMLDMSAALGQDMKSSAVQLGKALNDPILGITALSRVGVSFTEQQKEMITALVESGDTMGAQKIILAELNKEFGGSAKAQRDPIIQIKNAIGDMAEKIGMRLLPTVNSLIEHLSIYLPGAIDTVMGGFDTMGKWIKEHPEDIERLKNIAIIAFEAIQVTIQTMAEAWESNFLGIRTAVGLVTDTIRELIDAITWLDRNWDRIIGGIADTLLRVPGMESLILEIAGKRGTGGPVSAGKSYIVGERGPELFTPGSSGSIVPNSALTSMNATVNVTIMGNANEEDVRSGVRGGLDDVLTSIRLGRATGGF